MQESFESKIVRWLLIPGSILWLAVLFVPSMLSDSISIFRYSVGGPKGSAIAFTILPIILQFLAYYIVAVIYAIVLTIRYIRKSSKFVSTTRNFTLYSSIALLAMLCQIIPPVIGAWGYDLLNEKVVIAIVVLIVFVSGYFVYWAILTIRHEQIKLCSKMMLKSLLTNIGLFLISFVSIIVVFILACIGVSGI